MATESKKLIYKIVEGVSNGGNLQAALTKALTHHNTPAKRLDNFGTDGSHVRFLNAHRVHRKFLVGIFHRVTPGAGQYIINMSTADGEWAVELMPAPADEKTKREFVEGTLFFAVWKNHIIMHPAASCRFEQFQDYCSWLLSKPLPSASTVHEATLIGFCDPLPAKVRSKSNQPVKSIKLGTSIETRPISQPGATTKAASVRFKPMGRIWQGIVNILKQLNADVPDDLLLDSALDNRDVRVLLELSCTKKNSLSTAGEMLTKVGRILSDSDAQFTIELADGTKITPKEVKVETHVRVECIHKKPIVEAIFKAMVDWSQELVDNKVVIEEEAFGNTK